MEFIEYMRLYPKGSRIVTNCSDHAEVMGTSVSTNAEICSLYHVTDQQLQSMYESQMTLNKLFSALINWSDCVSGKESQFICSLRYLTYFQCIPTTGTFDTLYCSEDHKLLYYKFWMWGSNNDVINACSISLQEYYELLGKGHSLEEIVNAYAKEYYPQNSWRDAYKEVSKRLSDEQIAQYMHHGWTIWLLRDTTYLPEDYILDGYNTAFTFDMMNVMSSDRLLEEMFHKVTFEYGWTDDNKHIAFIRATTTLVRISTLQYDERKVLVRKIKKPLYKRIVAELREDKVFKSNAKIGERIRIDTAVLTRDSKLVVTMSLVNVV